MKWLFYLLRWHSCRHRWTRIMQIDLFQAPGAKMPHGHKFVLQCEKCGDIKSRKV